MSVWFKVWNKGWRPLAALLLWLGLAGTAQAQTSPALGDSVATPGPARQPAAAKPGQRPGSAPTPPVRYISPDPRDPVGPPPPGATNPGQGRIPAPSPRAVPDTLAPPAFGTNDANDTLSLRPGRKGQIESTVKYAATDSIQFDIGTKTARLYNKANVDYGQMNMKAALITVNYGENLVLAEGRMDTVKHRLEGRPVVKDGSGLYTAGRIAYNIKTKKGRINDVVTKQGEGYVEAETIKKQPDNSFYGEHGRYTTCNLEHPHFYFGASRMKVTDKYVVTGPFNLVIGDVPTPLGFLFGFFPKTKGGRGSGVLIPTFGQAADRGYYLTNGGYYFAPTDNVGVRLTGDVYAGNGQSFGGWGGTADVQYLKRYAYNGTFNFRYTNRPATQLVPVAGTSTSPEYIRPPAAQTFWLSWSHNPVPRPGGGRFSASVQAGSQSYNRTNSLDSRRFLAPAFTSSISYSKQLRNLPINYSVKLSQDQNVQTGTMNFTLPDLSVGVARQYPYQWFGIEPRGRFYEQFTISYQGTAQNHVSNTVPARTLNGLPLLGGSNSASQLPISLANVGLLLRNAQSGVQHTFGIALGSYTVAKNFKLTPSVNVSAVSFTQKLAYRYVNEARAFRIDTARGFFTEYGYSAGLSLNTTVYGTVVFADPKKTRTIQAIRHKITPSLNYNFAPNLSNNPSAYTPYRRVFDPRLVTLYGSQYAGTGAFQNYAGALYSAPGGQLASQLGFSLQNSVELKVRNKDDTTGTNPSRKVSLIDGLDFTTSYNFAADSFQLAPLNITFRTQIAKKLNLNATATFVAYQRDSTGRDLNHFLFEQDHRRLARLTAAGIGATYTFNPASGKKKSAVPRAVAPANDPALGTPGPMAYYADYVDFDIPYELALTFNSSYSPTRVPLTLRSPYTPIFSLATVGITGSLKLTDNLRLNYSTGYDLVHGTITYPNITFFRDLHCWQISGNWIPLGQTRGYNFTISAKSSLLQDLKLNRNRLQQYR